MICIGPKCERPAKLNGLCSAHYMQSRRGNLHPLRTDDNTEQVTFRCPPELKRGAERDAKRKGIETAEWWRNVGRERLKK